MTTSVNITKCDNELYVIATTGAGTSEICHITSGYFDPVAYQVKLNSILPAGSYDLTLIGINWGGPAAFSVNVGGKDYTYNNQSAPVGVVWTQTIQVKI
ncbi:hypothetical protein [Lysobacter enzymogenes]|uniref:hypothetical protein n=1 Tax=Lysobacter enzymogenes TaxID=69 RepID=UPI001AF40430|nr:hypothetical protein [Lysobacter enzymogenes]QQP99468.1 hypothetical protein JHW41_15210 [Lysobacter enzymogenes]